MSLALDDYQLQAIDKLKNGSILNGGVGSGKSRTVLAYYFCKVCGGEVNGRSNGFDEDYIPMKTLKDLYIITTAQKRDKAEWEKELIPFRLSPDPSLSEYGEKVKVVIDSWNNIQKYKEVKNAFFVFDEQRVSGYGPWSQAFIAISRCNEWVLVTATPGDKWEDYIPVFIANGFYKNKTEFMRRHAVFSMYSKYPTVVRYLETGRLLRLRQEITVKLYSKPKTVKHSKTVICAHNDILYKYVSKNRKNPETHKPIKNISEYCYTLRRIVNSDDSRAAAVLEIMDKHPKVIIFYNFNFELDILKNLKYPKGTAIAEWNSHNHDPLPEGDKWVYLVQYNAGAEGWNCITTDTIIFYSQNYSYKMMHQASGRIDRRNTPYTDLFYYHLRSNSLIDLAIQTTLKKKKKFNESTFAG